MHACMHTALPATFGAQTALMSVFRSEWPFIWPFINNYFILLYANTVFSNILFYIDCIEFFPGVRLLMPGMLTKGARWDDGGDP